MYRNCKIGILTSMLVKYSEPDRRSNKELNPSILKW